jgi:hypothetical protein
MAENTESRVRGVLLGYFPMFIATLSLMTSIYNGYLNSKFVDLIRHNVSRIEYMKTCKEIIDSYFQVKLRIGLLNKASQRPTAGESDQAEAANAIAKFGALGTYLANLRDEETRAHYTELSESLDKIATDAKNLSPADLERRYAKPDQQFTGMNDDCVKAAKELPM